MVQNFTNFYTQLLLFLLILLTAMFFSVKMNKLTRGAAITGGIAGICIFVGSGYAGIAMIGLFFVLGSFATSWKINVKQNSGIAEKNDGRRTPGQVIANGGIAAILGLMAFLFPQHKELLVLMMAGSLAAATADTLSSELGTVYGKKFYNILTFNNDQRGENGVVSLEGTILGILGSTTIAVVYVVAFGWSNHFSWIVIAGTIGNITDSILGATFERKHYLENNAVNLLNTITGALVAWLLFSIF